MSRNFEFLSLGCSLKVVMERFGKWGSLKTVKEEIYVCPVDETQLFFITKKIRDPLRYKSEQHFSCAEFFRSG